MGSKNIPLFGLLKVSGQDAKKFLQGQLTCDVESLTPAGGLGAHCNPQGRVISLFKIFPSDDSFYLLMPNSMTEITQKALRKYAPFFKVTIEDDSKALPTLIQSFQISDLPRLKHDNLVNGIPAIYPETSEKFLPHELNLHQLGGISFDKGCYTGQEIIARMHYRGKVKSHLYRGNAKLESPPSLGADLYASSGNVCGMIADFASNKIDISPYVIYHFLIVCNTEDAVAQKVYLDQARSKQLTVSES